MKGKANSRTLSKRLVKAIGSKELERVKRIVEQGFDLKKEIVWSVHERFTALQSAISNGSPETVAYLIAQGVDVNQCRFGWTPLMRACDLGREDVCDLLLEAGAEVNTTSWGDFHERGESALILAAHRGTVRIVRKLLAAGADAL